MANQIDENELVTEAQSINLPDISDEATDFLSRYIANLVRRVNELVQGLPWYLQLFANRLVEVVQEAIRKAIEDVKNEME